MRAHAAVVIALVASSVLCGCQTALVRKTDQDALCGASVVAAPDLVTFKPNPLADPVAGPALGTGMGALAAIAAIAMPVYLFAVPAAVGKGIACGQGALTHPTADADFRRIFSSADIDTLRRSLAEEIDRPRDACRVPPENRSARAATIVIERVETMPGCPAGDWTYGVAVSWRVKRADGSDLVPLRQRGCGEATFRDVDVWFADPELGRTEIEEVLAATGKRIASDLLSDDPPDPRCAFSTLSGKVTPQ